MKALAVALARLEPLRRGLGLLTNVLDLGIRLYVARVFFLSGLTKVRDWDTTLLLFSDEYHVPLLPTPLAAFAGTAGELVFPVLLALGLATRFSAFGLSMVNVMAVVSYWHVLGQEDAAAALAQHVHWGVLLLVPLLHGPGRLSLDSLVWRRLALPPRAAG
jgi:putative oxidoreductase